MAESRENLALKIRVALKKVHEEFRGSHMTPELGSTISEKLSKLLDASVTAKLIQKNSWDFLVQIGDRKFASSIWRERATKPSGTNLLIQAMELT